MQNKIKEIVKGFIQHQISFFKKRKFGAGFTLIELLVVIAIIGLLSSVVLVSLSSARTKAKEAKVKTEIHGIKLALEEYNAQYGGYPNPGATDGSYLYCIGSDDCLLGGSPVANQLEGEGITAFIKINTSNIASSFPVFSEITELDEENHGYIYVSCERDTSQKCGDDEAVIIYPKPTANAVVYMDVGTFEETECNGNVCETSTSGCTDQEACNYNSQANSDDGSCEYTSCVSTSGCMDTQACNYNVLATLDDGSCEYTSCHGESCQGIISISCMTEQNEPSCTASPYSYICSFTPGTSGYCSGTITGDCTGLGMGDCGGQLYPGCYGEYDPSGTMYTCYGTYSISCPNDYNSCISNPSYCTWVPEVPSTCIQTVTECSSFNQQSCGSVPGCNWTTY